jgi:hypothetical protein
MCQIVAEANMSLTLDMVRAIIADSLKKDDGMVLSSVFCSNDKWSFY